MILKDTGDILANISQPTLSFNTEAKFNTWLATLPAATDANKFVIIKDYEEKPMVIVVNGENFTLESIFPWENTIAYKKNCLVIDKVAGVSYYTLKAVPAGTSLTNRDFYLPIGGSQPRIPCGDCTEVRLEERNMYLIIKWLDPVSTDWAATKLVRKKGSYPVDENDGELLVTNTIRNQYDAIGFYDKSISDNGVYCYKLFPISKSNGISYAATNNCNGTSSSGTIYGIMIDESNSDPNRALTYIDDAIGMTPGTSEWDSKPIFNKIKPCLLDPGTETITYLDPNNFNLKLDGTPAVLDGTTGADVMIQIPKVGIQIERIRGKTYIRITNDPRKKGFRYLAFSRNNEGDRDYLFVGAYEAYMETNATERLWSISGYQVAGQVNLPTLRKAAKVRNANLGLLNYNILIVIQIFYLIRFKDRNSRNVIGSGISKPTSSKVKTGLTNDKGMFYGKPANTDTPIKCFGIENLWGNTWTILDGVCISSARDLMTAFKDFNDDGNGYTNNGKVSMWGGSGYLAEIAGTTEIGFMPGTARTDGGYFCDSQIITQEATGVWYGGAATDQNSGIFKLNANRSALSFDVFTSSRLVYV